MRWQSCRASDPSYALASSLSASGFSAKRRDMFGESCCVKRLREFGTLELEVRMRFDGNSSSSGDHDIHDGEVLDGTVILA